MNICIIPARGGSKRIPYKNVKNFYDKPMISYPIETAKRSQMFDKIIVSTDDKKIAEIAQQYGADILNRPAELADDHATTVAVIRHAITALSLQEQDNVCCLYPCTPLLTVDTLVHAFELWQQSTAEYCFPVLAFETPISRALKVDNNKQVSTIFNDEMSRTQDLATTYHDAGQFYWGKVQSWQTQPSIHNHAVAMILPKHSVVDIDDEADWQLAEALYRSLISCKKL